jgi:hypothetical protein
MKLLVVLVNYGDEQLNFLEKVVAELKSFVKYTVTIIVQSNIPIQIKGIDKVNVVKLKNYQLLPLTCRKEIWERRADFDFFIYGENDHLFLEKHLDNHILYSTILPKNRIPGLLQYEENAKGRYYPGYHNHFDWQLNSVETHQDKKFAHFSNAHQATFILTKSQLIEIGKKFNFNNLVKFKVPYLLNNFVNMIKKLVGFPIKGPFKYSLKCKVNTDIYDFGGMKKVICVSEFEDNLIHHLPNLYIDGIKGRAKLNADEEKMKVTLKNLLKSDL